MAQEAYGLLTICFSVYLEYEQCGSKSDDNKHQNRVDIITLKEQCEFTRTF